MVADSKRIVGIENKEAEECRRTGIENGFSALTTLCPLFSAAAYRVEYAGQGFSGGREACSFPLYTGLYRVSEDGDLRVSLMTGTDDSSRIPPEIAKAGSDLLATIAIRFFVEAALERSVRKGRESRELMRKMNSELSLAEERERKKIASDLHDHIEQALSMLRFRLAELRSNAVFCGFESCIEEMETLLEQTIRYTRGLTVTISQPLLFEIGLAAAIQWLCEDFAKRFGLPVRAEVSDDGSPVPENVKILIYKIAGELLSNGAKHAEAQNVALLLRIGEGKLRLDYTDNGRGFDPERAASEMADGNSWGLFSVRERVGFLGGKVKISSAPGSGTHISFQIPLEQTDGGRCNGR